MAYKCNKKVGSDWKGGNPPLPNEHMQPGGKNKIPHKSPVSIDSAGKGYGLGLTEKGKKDLSG